MPDNTANSSRIAKNTIILYLRMIVLVIVGLFTSRIILDSLGVEDYGIYNVVGGFVMMFNILRAGLTSATQRFITFDLGQRNYAELNKTFSTTVIIFLMISAFIVFLSESIGVWFIDNKLTIPTERLYAAHWVFQLSLATLVIGIISYPYNSLLIAHEKMNAFAFIAIYEVCAKLGVAYLLYITKFDRLIVYALLICLVQLSTRIIYGVYCKKHFPESKIKWYFDWAKIKKIYSFTGWAMFGGLASLGFTQGLNMLLGMFFSPMVNAARGVAVTVQSFVGNFVTNFQTAINPQLIKAYAAGEYNYMYKLLYSSAKMSYFLLFILTLPIFLEADEILNLWLVEVPEYAVIFFRLSIITTMIDAISNSIMTSVESTGNIRNYQIIVGGILLMIVPISYIVLKLGGDPTSVFIVHIIVSVIAFCVRLIMGSKVVGFLKKEYLKKVLIPIAKVTLLSATIPILLHLLLPDSLLRVFVVCFISVSLVAIITYFVGLESQERKLVQDKIKSVKSKLIAR